MTLPDAAVASSATSEQPVVSALEAALASGDQASYSAARQAERLGTSLEPIVPASAAGQPAEQAADTAASSEAASEPAAASGHKGNAETRKAELQAEIAALLKQRAELRRETSPPAEANATPASQPAPKAEGEPKLSDFEADPDRYPDPFGAWLDARIEWRAGQAVETRLQRDARATTLAQREDAFQKRLVQVFADSPSLTDVEAPEAFFAVPSSAVAPGEPVTPENDLAEALRESDTPVDLMRYLSEQPKELAALLASPNPRAFWRTLGQVEGRMARPTKLAPKTITDAPTPPPTVGTRHESGTSLDVALKTGDQAAYNAERRRQRLAAMRQ